MKLLSGNLSLYLSIGLVSVLFFGYLESQPSFADPDSFYHAKITQLMIEKKGPLFDFPWLPLTTLSDSFTDHHFLYHLLLIPFVVIFPPLIGIKVSAVFFATLCILALCWFFERVFISQNQKYRFFWICALAVLLVTNVYFAHRLALPKIPAVSLIWLVLGLYAIARQKIVPLFFLSFSYVWLYGGWPVIVAMSLVAWVTRGFFEVDFNEIKPKNPLVFLSHFALHFFKRLTAFNNFSVPLTSLLGALAGLVVNPYFPTNISFLWLQLVKFALLKSDTSVGVGGEWYSPDIMFLTTNVAFFLLLLGALFITLLPPLRKLGSVQWHHAFIGVGALLFLLLTFRSQRYNEYAIPLGFLFSLGVLAPVLSGIISNWWSKRATLSLLWGKDPLKATLGIYIICALGSLTIGNTVILSRSFTTAPFSLYAYDGAGRWLADHTPKNSLIFHNLWDDFPGLFFANPQNTYVSGLDHRFFFEKNPLLFERYEKIVHGAENDSGSSIKRLFDSEYVFVRKAPKSRVDQFEKDPGFSKAFEDDYSVVYKIL